MEDKASPYGIGAGAVPVHEHPLVPHLRHRKLVQVWIVLDGRGYKDPKNPDGWYIGPSIFDEVTPEMTIGKEEIFGPVLCIMRAKDFDEAVAIVRKHELGNATSIFTSSGRHAREYRYRVEPSMLGVNIGVAAPMAFFPFGGAKQSFFGDLKAHGRDSVEFYTDKKVMITRWW